MILLKKSNFIFIFLISLLFFSGCSTDLKQLEKDLNKFEESTEVFTNTNYENSNENLNIKSENENFNSNLTIISKNLSLISNNLSQIKIANWNLQIFGRTKAKNDSLLNLYANKINKYDIIFIEEIRDSSQTSFPKLCEKLPNYDCMISSRAGRSTSKEQIGVIYKKGILIKDFIDYNPDLYDRWERPPIKVIFNISNYIVEIYNIHVKPKDVSLELKYLEELILNETNSFSDLEVNRVVLGDFNADCSYYSNKKENEFDSWNWIISDLDDTTVAKSSCAYDRIFLNNNSYDEFLDYGIDSKNISKKVSDHYLIWLSLEI